MLNEQTLAIRAARRLGIKPADGTPEYNRQGVYIGNDPVTFLEREMYIADTGGPLVLHPEQKAVLREMFRRDENGFVYENIVYSSIKKSAKTTIGAGIALWQAFRIPYGEIYIIGNDLNQADSRMTEAIRFTIENNPRMRGIKLSPSTYLIKLPNRTKIHTIPVDPAGEAGMNPTGLFWTEAWGAKSKKHQLMWTEAQISPTRRGESFSFMESYAGHTGESVVLERQYENIVKQGEKLEHVAPELYARGRSIAYWNTRAYLPWQTPDYYADQETRNTPKEFRRIHKNEWGTSEDTFIEPEWWDSCFAELTGITEKTPIILSVDAGVSSDCFAVIGVTKKQVVIGGLEVWLIIVVSVEIWIPPDNGKLDFALPEKYIREYYRKWNVLEICYDPYQLHDMMTRFRHERKVLCREFPQGGDRLIADNNLRVRIVNRQIQHSGFPALREHILSANAKTDGNDSRLRIVKRNENLKIDAAVCLSMAAERAMRMNM